MRRILILIMLLSMLSIVVPVYATAVKIKVVYVDLGSVTFTQDKHVASLNYDISNYEIGGKIKIIASGIAISDSYGRYLIITDKPVSGSWWTDEAAKSSAIYFAYVATAFTVPIDRTDYFIKNKQGTLYVGISVSGNAYWKVTLKLRIEVIEVNYPTTSQANVSRDQAILLGLGALVAITAASIFIVRMRR
ncbi:hypothetical protein JdFRA1000001_15c [uncultured archaeal virus]|jgi:hypothetical protein|uniref:Uncharacterized protein n=1 Tax=uncultured archaeal virus TaxID=1960247 RepID=A0A1S5Y2W2_9VIRU|nr:hypothetical protein JdFRA1000001_15c [uncultured archaeal virus]